MNWLVSVLVVVMLAGCATPYQRSGAMGGFSETRLAQDAWTVSFDGNGYTGDERATDFMLLRAAELAILHGFPYFVMVDREDHGRSGEWTSPTRTSTSGRVDRYGNFSSQSRTTGGQTHSWYKPGKAATVMGLRERPAGQMVYEAEVVSVSVREKYGIEPDIRARRAAIRKANSEAQERIVAEPAPGRRPLVPHPQ